MAAAPCWSRSNRSAAQKCFNESFVLLKLLKHFIPSKMADEVGAMLHVIGSLILFLKVFRNGADGAAWKKKENKLIPVNTSPNAARDEHFKKCTKLLLGNHTGLFYLYLLMKTSSHSADQLMQLQRTSYAFIFYRIFTNCRVLIFLEVSQHDPHSLWTFKTRVFSFSLSFSFLKNL